MACLSETVPGRIVVDRLAGPHKPAKGSRPFQQEPDFAVDSINYDLWKILSHGEAFA
jgi:hypothetical protein